MTQIECSAWRSGVEIGNADVPANQTHRPQSAGSHEAAAPTGSTTMQTKLKLLIVEDDPFIRMDIAAILQDFGYDVLEADCGEQGIEILRRTPVDVIVADVGLPGMSGPAFATQAREAFPSVGLVFATGNTSLPDAGQFPGSVLLSKPFSTAALGAAIRLAVQKRPLA